MTNDTQKISEWGLNFNRNTRQEIKKQILDIQTSRILKDIGVEVIAPFHNHKNTRYMKIESYLNYRGVE